MIKNKNVLVTGGAGFIGSHLVKRLLKEDYIVTVIDNLSEGSWKNLPKHKNLFKHKASILGKVAKYVKNQDIIFHLAAIPWPQKSILDPLTTHDVNVNGTLNLLLAARQHNVKKFILSSSYTVHPKPMVPYSLQKLTSEMYCKLFSELWGLNTISLRYFNVYGPGMKSDGIYANLLPKFIKLISKNLSPEIYGDGKQTRDFIHVSDIVEANVVASMSNLTNGVFNIGSGKSTSVNGIIETLNKLMGKNVKPIYKPAVIEPKVASAAYKGAKKLPGWSPKVKFEEGLKTMLS